MQDQRSWGFSSALRGSQWSGTLSHTMRRVLLTIGLDVEMRCSTYPTPTLSHAMRISEPEASSPMRVCLLRYAPDLQPHAVHIPRSRFPQYRCSDSCSYGDDK